MREDLLILQHAHRFTPRGSYEAHACVRIIIIIIIILQACVRLVVNCCKIHLVVSTITHLYAHLFGPIGAEFLEGAGEGNDLALLPAVNLVIGPETRVNTEYEKNKI